MYKRQILKPLRDLITEDNLEKWGDGHTKTFERVKKMLTEKPVLAFYEASRRTRVTADSSAYGLGACLEQEHVMDGGRKIWRPVCCASRSLSETERRYAQIEKEALALKLAVTEKLKLYLLGLPGFVLQTDHRPLAIILGKKALCDLTPRLHNFKVKLMEYRYIVYIR